MHPIVFDYKDWFTNFLFLDIQKIHLVLGWCCGSLKRKLKV